MALLLPGYKRSSGHYWTDNDGGGTGRAGLWLQGRGGGGVRGRGVDMGHLSQAFQLSKGGVKF